MWERECGRVCERENERMIELWAPPTQNCPNRACVCDRKRERDSVRERENERMIEPLGSTHPKLPE